jgi:predicted hydrocarbon binding protein
LRLDRRSAETFSPAAFNLRHARSATGPKAGRHKRKEEKRSMDTIVTISGADKAGSLARILSFLAHKGYGVKGQQITELPSGSRLLKFRLGLAQLDKERLAAEIKALNPDYEVINVSFEGNGSAEKRATSPEQSAAALIKEMAGKFPDIVPLVRAYGGAFDLEARGRALLEAGTKLGRFHYKKDWSFGSPLKMPAALRRALVPAMEKFAVVQATDSQVALPESPFCGHGEQINCCDFLTGFMRGFLDAGPLSAKTRVEKTACKASGDTHCVYTVTY